LRRPKVSLARHAMSAGSRINSDVNRVSPQTVASEQEVNSCLLFLGRSQGNVRVQTALAMPDQSSHELNVAEIGGAQKSTNYMWNNSAITTGLSQTLLKATVRVTADVYSHAIRGRDDEAARR